MCTCIYSANFIERNKSRCIGSYWLIVSLLDQQTEPSVKDTEGPRPLSKRKQRRRLYGNVQELYKKNRTRCAKTVVSDDWAKEKQMTGLSERNPFENLSSRNQPLLQGPY